jgi:hypothetical protein
MKMMKTVTIQVSSLKTTDKKAQFKTMGKTKADCKDAPVLLSFLSTLTKVHGMIGIRLTNMVLGTITPTMRVMMAKLAL